MSVWYCIPSARADGGTIQAWRERGYLIGVFRDEGAAFVDADIIVSGPYPGYAQAVNVLAREAMRLDSRVEWIVTGGDDVLPSMEALPVEIARECTAHFGGTLGVMQPTGDRFAGGSIDRIAGSPWMGREWCERANGGQGPLWPEFVHMFVDECIQRTAQKLGVFWQRPDLIHLHQHFQRESNHLHARAVPKPTPEHLVRWNSPEHWQESKSIFKRLEASGFAECMPLEKVTA